MKPALNECSQCGQRPDDDDEDHAPEVIVLAENFGEPYRYGVRCRICYRVAAGIGEAAAIQRWNDGYHDGDMDPMTNEMEEKT